MFFTSVYSLTCRTFCVVCGLAFPLVCSLIFIFSDFVFYLILGFFSGVSLVLLLFVFMCEYLTLNMSKLSSFMGITEERGWISSRSSEFSAISIQFQIDIDPICFNINSQGHRGSSLRRETRTLLSLATITNSLEEGASRCPQAVK